jgi:hypothetical protein
VAGEKKRRSHSTSLRAGSSTPLRSAQDDTFERVASINEANIYICSSISLVRKGELYGVAARDAMSGERALGDDDAWRCCRRSRDGCCRGGRGGRSL